jgi:hypothetical protein
MTINNSFFSVSEDKTTESTDSESLSHVTIDRQMWDRSYISSSLDDNTPLLHSASNILAHNFATFLAIHPAQSAL